MSDKKKTTYTYLDGTALFSHLNKPNEWGNYTLKLTMDDENYTKYSELKLGLETHEGNAVFFRRPHSKIIKGELVEFGPPEVVDIDGKPFNKMIGTGSKVAIKISSYDTIKGPGHTLLGVQVVDLVPVESSGERRNF